LFSQDKSAASKFYDFSIVLSPNTDGLVDSRAEINIFWTPWIDTSASFTSESFSQALTSGNDSSNIITSTKRINLQPFRINQELLWNILGLRLDFLTFNLGIIGKGVWINSNEYGYKESTTTDYFYIEKSDLTYFKPLVVFSTGLRIYFITLEGYGEVTPIPVSEHSEGSYLNSITNAKENFTIDDIGFESNYGVKLSIYLGLIDIGFKFNILRHIGYSQKYFQGIFNTYPYESNDLNYSIFCQLGFLNFNGNTPYIGVSLSQHIFIPVKQYGLESFKNEKYSVDLGFQL
jgi:hypothetical protein